jgi:Mrp family chromosome partitioning ATPase
VLAGSASTMPYELLKSPRLTSLLRTLRERFDYVVIDTPPVVPFPDVSIVRDLVDGFVIVVRANQTPRELLRDSLHVIGAGRVIGVIFNDYARPSAATKGDAGWRGRLARPLGGARAA